MKIVRHAAALLGLTTALSISLFMVYIFVPTIQRTGWDNSSTPCAIVAGYALFGLWSAFRLFRRLWPVR